MNTHRRTPFIESRRKFLKQAGVATVSGVVPVSGMGAMGGWEAERPRRPGAALRMGLLLPESLHFGTQREGLVQGLRLGLALQTLEGSLSDANILRIPVGRGGSGVREGYETLAAERRVDVVVGLMTVGIAAQQQELVQRHAVPLVVINGGTDVVRRHESKPGIWHASFPQWQAEQALGHWAGRQLGGYGVVLTSPYEGGYDGPFAFMSGADASGARVSQHVGRPDDDARQLAARLREFASERPHFIYAAYAGAQAELFVDAWRLAGLAGTIPLLLSGLMLSDGAVQRAPELAGAHGATCWSPDLTGDANRQFIQTYERQYGHAPGLFAALGYETALLFGQSGPAGARFSGLAGAVVMERDTLSRTLWLQRLDPGAGSRTVGALDALPLGALAALDGVERTGLTTPCLCA